MRRLLTFLLAGCMVLGFALMGEAYSHHMHGKDGHNKHAYKAEARNMRVLGQATIVYEVVSSDNTPVQGAIVGYYANRTYTEGVTDAKGRVKITTTSPTVFELDNVVVSGVKHSIHGEDIREKFDAEDVLEGDVEMYRLTKCPDQKAFDVCDLT